MFHIQPDCLCMSAAAVIAARRRRLIRRFRAAGATSAECTVTLESLGERHGRVFRRMTEAGVFIATPDGRYFMNEVAAAEYRRRCRKRALIGAGICVLVFLLLWLIGLLAR